MTAFVKFREARDPGDFVQIAGLADIIWREHYTPIIGKAQVDYMLEHFQSAEAISKQIAGGMVYYRMLQEDRLVGYLAIQKRGQELFLSKIYLLREYRGLGMGKAALDFITEKARGLGCTSIALTVNKNNDRSIKAYLKMGFENKGGRITDIGDGFVMDDYLMVRSLKDMPSGAAGNFPA